MNYLPTFPIDITPLMAFGLMLIIGAVGGYVAHRLSWLPSIAAQIKPVVQPHQSGDGSVEYIVLHVSDFVVVDHGIAVAKYKIPPGDALQAGQRIVINKDGSIATSLERTEPETGKGRAD